jgi:hypothetical protein
LGPTAGCRWGTVLGPEPEQVRCGVALVRVSPPRADAGVRQRLRSYRAICRTYTHVI